MTHTFTRLVAAAGLPPIRFHDLRHGAASLSLAAGNDLKVVQAMLGHSSIVLTADTYTSVLPCLAHRAAEATAALVLEAARDAAASLRSRGSGKRRGRGKGRHALNKKAKSNGRQRRSHSAPRRSHP